MPLDVLRDNRFRNLYLVRSVGKFIPALISFYFLWQGWGRFNLNTLLGALFFVGGIFVWAWQDRQSLRNYHCPRCHQHIPKPTIAHRKQGDPIHFRCEVCEIEWDTGLRES